MADANQFEAIFGELRAILKEYEDRLQCTIDQPGHYSLDGAYSPKYKKAVFFGAVQVKKNYVSYYLMPVYIHPYLLAGLSDPLKKRMQGKSCFNFTRIDPDNLSELRALTAASFADFQAEMQPG
jgi:hypothetical protein